MLISEIPFKKVRELAESMLPKPEFSVREGFLWPKGHGYFWDCVDRGRWDEAKALRPDLFDEEEGQATKTANQIVPMHMPQLPDKWIYTGEYRRPHKGEFILINGKVRVSRGQEMAYPIVVREPEAD